MTTSVEVSMQFVEHGDPSFPTNHSRNWDRYRLPNSVTRVVGLACGGAEGFMVPHGSPAPVAFCVEECGLLIATGWRA